MFTKTCYYDLVLNTAICLTEIALCVRNSSLKCVVLEVVNYPVWLKYVGKHQRSSVCSLVPLITDWFYSLGFMAKSRKSGGGEQRSVTCSTFQEDKVCKIFILSLYCVWRVPCKIRFQVMIIRKTKACQLKQNKSIEIVFQLI